ncbi:1-acyl-sn-glycerol-3-phosphate acyltransferase [Candidatus Dependentiae bacterium Noda2021]|nr:1-acyl-sn-glycerol-3-phosphate acyltransferase [Candidatus Dependentiae bacterium Noda2021]
MLVMRIIHTTISYVLLLLLSIVFALPVLIIVLLPREYVLGNKVVLWVERVFYYLALKCTLVPVRYKGHRYVPAEPAVIVANHQSSLDIPLVGSAMNGFSHVWMAMSDLLKSPVLRVLLLRTAVMVDMSSPMKGMRSLIEAIKVINNKHMHVIIFPEGQRHTDGQVHDFFGGFVILAKKTGRPVVPIRIFNASKVYSPTAWLAQFAPITVVIGEPMHMEPEESDQAFKERVFDWFIHVKE